ncbi:MAG TPA: glycosyltransferase [Tahibacter sp.]|uniref:glycosyltransferase n=1 Tax=Tahibacter sp. TaxID=2056211 RepID=UPI002C62AE25|nr:glycosyltransferase [Tahibacter sp.]HSX59128.1 glycosyltransferase [Tahibacter sp.]
MTQAPAAVLPHRLDWDGVHLRLALAPSAAVEVRLDGQRYATLQADADGHAQLALPLAPNGRERINVQLAAGGAESATVSLRFGRPGLGRAVDVAPLAPLPSQEFVDLAAHADAMTREVAIVVPVYNAPDAVAACLDSVLAQTRGAARLIVIDDASTDPAIAPLLAHYRARRGVTLLANECNRGFTATANRGIEAAGRADVVLLNADTEVAAHWLTGLRRAAWASADTASATAVSDNAGAFSVPELERHCPFPQQWTFAQAALALRQQAGSAYPRLPTGNGFCLYLKRAALDAVGLLDAEAFAQGYGEENDWCQRAEAAGWRHVIAGDVLVRHARSQSFGDERRRVLGEAGMAVLRSRWPRYEADVGASLFSPRRRVLDWRVRRAYAGPAPQPRWLCWGDAAAPDGIEAVRVHRGEHGFVVETRDGVSRTYEPLAEASAATGGNEADWNASFARLLQSEAIDRVTGTLPPALARVAALLAVDTDDVPALRPFEGAA